MFKYIYIYLKINMYIVRSEDVYIYICICVCVCGPPLQYVRTFDGQMPLLPQMIAMEVSKVDHIRSDHTSGTWQTRGCNRDTTRM